MIVIGDFLSSIFESIINKIFDIQDAASTSVAEGMQAIVDIVEMDCGGNWVVYVRTAIDAIPDAMVLFLVPSKGEVLENYLEPKKGRRGQRRGRDKDRKRRPGKGGKMRLFFGGGIPDIDNAVAGVIPGNAYFRARSPGAKEFIFWTSIEVADRVLWHWLLIEASATLATSWQSNLMESGACVKGGEGYARAVTFTRGGSHGVPCWGSAGNLKVNVAKNLVISNQGTIQVPPAVNHVSGFIFPEVTYNVDNKNIYEVAHVKVGFQLFGVPFTGPPVLILQRNANLYIPPDTQNGLTIGGAESFVLMKSFQIIFYFQDISMIGPLTKDATATLYVQGIQFNYA